MGRTARRLRLLPLAFEAIAQERERAPDDLARAEIIIKMSELWRAGWVIHQVEARPNVEGFLHEAIDRPRSAKGCRGPLVRSESAAHPERRNSGVEPTIALRID